MCRKHKKLSIFVSRWKISTLFYLILDFVVVVVDFENTLPQEAVSTALTYFEKNNGAKIGNLKMVRMNTTTDAGLEAYKFELRDQG